MSEEILKALMRLFAIISVRDKMQNINHRNYVKTFLTQQLGINHYEDFLHQYDGYRVVAPDYAQDENKAAINDSIRILDICKKINKALTQKQKIIVLLRLFEFSYIEKSIQNLGRDVIITAATGFNFDKETIDAIEKFVSTSGPLPSGEATHCFHLPTEQNPSEFVNILFIRESNLFFFKTPGTASFLLNGIPVDNSRIYLFSSSSILRGKDIVLFYNNLSSHFIKTPEEEALTFRVQNLEFTYKSGWQGFHELSLSEENGKMIGIMGASGAGKSTLLNVLTGIEEPTKGKVYINDINIHTSPEKVKGLIGYVPQDNLLFDDLTVFENLYFSAELCFRGKPKSEIKHEVLQLLTDLDLIHIRDTRVGNVLDKKISGGQRKRLNIALELIRKPAILFMDEPTSGLSSKDSENVIDLVKKLSLTGKLIFVVIHQPSSDIFKLFDNILFLDKGGYALHYGSPLETISYFKTSANHINASISECEACGTLNPELIFNIVEEKLVDEYGRQTWERKISPEEWYQLGGGGEFGTKSSRAVKPIVLPGRIIHPTKQFFIFLKRDLLSKYRSRQYMLMTLLAAPFLGGFLSFLTRYNALNKGKYSFFLNDNFPAFNFFGILVIIFLGLTLSAEEIFRDRKIRKREKLLHLSNFYYYLSKSAIQFLIILISTLSYILISDYTFGVKDHFQDHFLMLFSVGCFSVLLGLNISSAFKDAVTIYILIPLFLIPQMLLSGAFIPFEQLNETISSTYKAPLISNVMVARWAYEGLLVNHFIKNNYDKQLYPIEKKMSSCNYNLNYLIPEIEKRVNSMEKEKDTGYTVSPAVTYSLNELMKKYSMEELNANNLQNPSEMLEVLEDIESYESDSLKIYENKENAIMSAINSNKFMKATYSDYQTNYGNQYLARLVKGDFLSDKIVESDDAFHRVYEPIYQNPKKGLFSFNTPLFIPQKYLFGYLVDTFYFNLSIIWAFSILLFVFLYFNIFKHFIDFFPAALKFIRLCFYNYQSTKFGSMNRRF